MTGEEERALLASELARLIYDESAGVMAMIDNLLAPGGAVDRIAAARSQQHAAEELLAPGDPDARMHAYYYGFDPTGVGIVDAILSAVAQAGKSYHSTESWADEDEWTSPSHEQRIQAAADAAVTALRTALRAGSGTP